MAVTRWLDLLGTLLFRRQGIELARRYIIDLGAGLVASDDTVQGSTVLSVAHPPVTDATTGTLSDYQLPIGCSALRLTGGVAINLTGIAGGTDGAGVLITRAGAGAVTLKHDVTSTAANRIASPGATDYALADGETVRLVYDATTQRWRREGPVPDSGTPGGATTQIQRNNAGSFGGVTGVTSAGAFMAFDSATGAIRYVTGANVGVLAWAPSAARTITFQDATGTVAFLADLPTVLPPGGGVTAVQFNFGGTTFGGSSSVWCSGSFLTFDSGTGAPRFANGANVGVLDWTPTAARAIDLPDASGTVALTSDVALVAPTRATGTAEGAQDNLDLGIVGGHHRLVRFTGAATGPVTGIVAPTGGTSAVLHLYHPNGIALENEDAASAAANRVVNWPEIAGVGQSRTSATLFYDTALARWVTINADTLI